MKKTNLYEAFRYSNGHNSPFDNMYIINDASDFRCSIEEIINEVHDELKKLNLPFEALLKIRGSIYVLMKSDDDFERIKNDEGLTNFCRENLVHILSGKWSKHFDLFDQKTYFLRSDEYIGSADDAATYHRVERVEYDPRLYFSEELSGYSPCTDVEANKSYCTLLDTVRYLWHFRLNEFLAVNIENNENNDNKWIYQIDYNIFWLNPGESAFRAIENYYIIVDAFLLHQDKKLEEVPVFSKGKMMLICDRSQVEQESEVIKEICLRRDASVVGLNEKNELEDYITGKKWKLDDSGREDRNGVIYGLYKLVSE